MSIQPGRPMLAALRETLRKIECSVHSDTPDQAQLKRILQRRIAEMELAQGQRDFLAGNYVGDTF